MINKEKRILFKITKGENPKSKEKQNKIWTKEEDSLLLKLIDTEKLTGNKINWKSIAQNFNKDYKKCYYRYRHIMPELKKGYWTKDEEEKLIEFIQIYGKKWSKISKSFGTRSGKQIRHHYINITDCQNNKHKFTKVEYNKLLELYDKYGSDWKLISTFFTGRSADNLKARFNNITRNKKNIRKTKVKNFQINVEINFNKATNNNILSDKVANSDLCINIEEKTINTDKIQCAYDNFYNIHFNIEQLEPHNHFSNSNYNFYFSQNYRSPFDDDNFHNNNFFNHYNNTIENNNFLKENDNNMEILLNSKICYFLILGNCNLTKTTADSKINDLNYYFCMLNYKLDNKLNVYIFYEFKNESFISEKNINSQVDFLETFTDNSVRRYNENNET